MRLVVAAALAASLLTALPAQVAAASVFVVNRIGDAADRSPGDGRCDSSAKSGTQCTLRAAIQEANALRGADTIKFKISAPSTVIRPVSPLPPITKALRINGYSQPGAMANTSAVGGNAVLQIVLDGSNAGAEANGLEIRANKVKVRGLVIQHWSGSGILINGSNNLVRGNYIGTDSTGTQPASNHYGIVIAGGSNNVVGGSHPGARNVVSANFDGVSVNGGSYNGVFGNYIGTTKSGAEALGNSQAGVVIRAPGTQVGSALASTGNVISGNALAGVAIVAVDADDAATIRRNLIGTDASGQLALANGHAGVDCLDSRGVTIGGAASVGNVISGNGSFGVELVDCTGAVISGNLVGLNISGSDAVGNRQAGIYIFGGTGAIVGGNTADLGNVISGNGLGIFMLGNGGFHAVAGNRIGTTADGLGDLGNLTSGIDIRGPDGNVIGGLGTLGNLVAFNRATGIVLVDSHSNTIGSNEIRDNYPLGIIVHAGPNAITGNAIRDNGSAGVVVAGGSGVRLSANAMAANGGIGIDLAGGSETYARVTDNDLDDPDTGPNGLQNFPVLASAFKESATGLTSVRGSLNSLASTEFQVELFLADPDASGNGEGQLLLASTVVSTDADGDATFEVSVANIVIGQRITATATNIATGDTSEFSANVEVVPAE